MKNRTKSIGKEKQKAKTMPKSTVVRNDPVARAITPQAQTYDTINEAVHEYLLKSGLFKTVDSFRVRFDNNLVARTCVWQNDNR